MHPTFLATFKIYLGYFLHNNQRKNNSILNFYIFISFLLNCVGKRKETKQRKENRRRLQQGLIAIVFFEDYF